jgi:hypothetical protein
MLFCRGLAAPAASAAGGAEAGAALRRAALSSAFRGAAPAARGRPLPQRWHRGFVRSSGPAGPCEDATPILRDYSHPSLESILASPSPRRFSEYSSETIGMMAGQGIHGAFKERLLREIMLVDQCSYGVRLARACCAAARRPPAARCFRCLRSGAP